MQVRKKAFTLIEVLVTITIIGVLSSIGMTSYMRALQNGRDGTRKSDISQLQQAYVMYRYEKGSYPSSKTAIVSDYISSFPLDPKTGNNTPYLYYSCSSQKKFLICVELEVKTGNASGYNTSSCTFTPVNGTGQYQCLTNP